MFVETLVRDTVLHNALIYKENHRQHDDDLDLHGAMLSLATHPSPSKASILTSIGTEEPPIALPTHFLNHQQERFDMKQFKFPHASRVNPIGLNEPIDARVALPLREQLSGDSRDWMADLWTTAKYGARGQGHSDECSDVMTYTSLQRSCVENPASAPSNTLTRKRDGKKMMQHASVASKKPKEKLPIEKPCAFALQEQLCGDSQQWVTFDLSTHNQNALPHLMAPELRGRFLPSDSAADQMNVNSSDRWSSSVPFHEADVMRDAPVAPAISTGISETALPWKGIPNPDSSTGTESGGGSSIRMLYDEPSLGDLSDVFSSIEKLDQTIRAFRCVMPEARHAEMEYKGLLSKSAGVGNLSWGSHMESGIDMTGCSQEALSTHVAV